MASRLGIIESPIAGEEGQRNGSRNGNGDRIASMRLAATPAVQTPSEAAAVDMPRVEAAVREMLLGLGEDPDREGLRDTPARVARAYREILGGMHEEPGIHLARQFSQEQTGDDLVILRDIDFVSVCEHHFLPFTGRAHIAYLPDHGSVTGLSKLVEHLDPRGVAVVVQAEHSCLKLRGARKADTEMVTTAFRGELRFDRALRNEVLGLMKMA